MKRLTKSQREMSREEFDHITWEIQNLQFGIMNRERMGTEPALAEIPGLRDRIRMLGTLQNQAIIICETENEMNDIAENSWS
jgi:hypothetical protein